jgi:rRNA processing protein Krr1/Pno1
MVSANAWNDLIQKVREAQRLEGKVVRAVGPGFSPDKMPEKSTWALLAAEKLVRAVGRGFIPGIKSAE